MVVSMSPRLFHRFVILLSSTIVLQQHLWWRESTTSCFFAQAFSTSPHSHPPTSAILHQHIQRPYPYALRSNNNDDDSLNTRKSGLFNIYDSKIPPELESEIYAAESRTPAAQGRTQRVVLYAIVAVISFGAALFNAFLTDLQDTEGVALSSVGLAWVEEVGVAFFLLRTKLGGFLFLFLGGASGLLAEAELDTRRINAEKIFAEMQRRREMRRNPRKSTRTTGKKPKKLKKSLQALAEVTDLPEQRQSDTATEDETMTSHAPAPPANSETSGLFGKVKQFYEKADSMAATQALLLNKKLEEEGVVEKITDETGLKVIGKEAASKIKKEKDE